MKREKTHPSPVLLAALLVPMTFGAACSGDDGGEDAGQDPDGAPDFTETMDATDPLPDPAAEDVGSDDSGPPDGIPDVPDEGEVVELCDGVSCTDLCGRIFDCSGEVDPEGLAECIEACRLGLVGDPEMLACVCDNIAGECEDLMACGMGPGCGSGTVDRTIECTQTGPDTYHCVCSTNDSEWECDGTGTADCEEVHCCEF